MAKGYKLLTPQSGCSGVSWIDRNPRQVAYVLGVPTEPRRNCGPLAVFTQLEEAEDFLDRCLRGFGEVPFAVWECEYVPAVIHKSLWDDLGNNMTTLPKGTALASSVTITKKVKEGGLPI